MKVTAGSNIRQPTEECQQVGSYKRQLHKVSHHHHHRLDGCLPWAENSARQLGPNFVMWLLSASPTLLLQVMISENMNICGVKIVRIKWNLRFIYFHQILQLNAQFEVDTCGPWSLWGRSHNSSSHHPLLSPLWREGGWGVMDLVSC